MAFPTHDPGVIEFLAQTDPNKLEGARETMITLLEKLPTASFTAEDVERAKRQLLKDRERLMTQPGRVATELSEWAAQGDWRLFCLHRDRVSKVTPSDKTAQEPSPTRPPASAPQPVSPASAPQPVSPCTKAKSRLLNPQERR